MSYAPDVPDLFRRAGRYVHLILNGARPSELPVEQPTRYELLLNRGAAMALGLNIPNTLLLSADRVLD